MALVVNKSKKGAMRGGEPLLMAASVYYTVCFVFAILGSVIPVFAVVIISTTGEYECSNYECNHN